MSETIWTKYPHIERIDSEEVQGLLELDNLWIEPKIDGANASVLMDENGVLRAAKRSGVLDTDADFRGLLAYTYENQDKFLKFFEKYPRHIIYGEWLVKHTVWFYRENAWRKFYAYDILDLDNNKFYDPETRVKMLAECEINQIAPIVKLKGPLITDAHIQQLEWYMNNNRYLIDEKDKFGEGIVIKGFSSDLKPYVNKYGRTTWLKMVKQEFKEKHVIMMGAPEKEMKTDSERIFAETFVTSGRVEKIKEKICDDKGTGWQSKYIGELLGRVYNDVFTEELWGFVKKNKIKAIDFKTLNQYVVLRTKKVIGL